MLGMVIAALAEARNWRRVGIGIATRHQPGKRAVSGHAEAAEVVDDDQADAAGFLALGADAGASAAPDERPAFIDFLAEAFQDFGSGFRHG